MTMINHKDKYLLLSAIFLIQQDGTIRIRRSFSADNYYYLWLTTIS